MLSLCLLISADPRYVVTLQGSLKEHGIKLYGAGDLASARPVLEQWQFDAILCDADGYQAGSADDTVRTLRRIQRAPVVVLAPPGGDDGPIATLEAGATSLIARTGSPRLVALKLQRLMDLAGSGGDPEPRAVWFGDLKLDPRRAQAVFRDQPLPLTGGEFELLLLLAARADGFVHRRTLLRSLGRTSAGEPQRRSADMHVCRLRRKLREAGASTLELETVYGQGYALRLRYDPVQEAVA
ncbi:MAG: winged helix-turn-helix domain-containing protein [Burkholderiales bacterium]|nr:winged helix-turn-helix domain-containing protein [Burkholderiales bacterium]